MIKVDLNRIEVNGSVKRFWGSRWTTDLYGYHAKEQLGITEEEDFREFDRVWKKDFVPNLEDAPVLTAREALKSLPNDARRKFFKADQEHRQVIRDSKKYLVQIDWDCQEVTQIWDFQPKTNRGATPAGIDLNSLAEVAGVSKEEVAKLIMGMR